MGRKHRFRFGFPDVFAGRLFFVQGRRWLIANSVCCAPPDGVARKTGAATRAAVRFKKPATGFSGAGSIVAMMNICR